MQTHNNPFNGLHAKIVTFDQFVGKEFSNRVKLNEIPIGMGPLIPNRGFQM